MMVYNFNLTNAQSFQGRSNVTQADYSKFQAYFLLVSELVIIMALVCFLVIWYRAYYAQTKQSRVDRLSDASSELQSSETVRRMS